MTTASNADESSIRRRVHIQRCTFLDAWKHSFASCILTCKLWASFLEVWFHTRIVTKAKQVTESMLEVPNPLVAPHSAWVEPINHRLRFQLESPFNVLRALLVKLLAFYYCFQMKDFPHFWLYLSVDLGPFAVHPFQFSWGSLLHWSYR